MLDHYDTDSLTYLSEAIVRAMVGAAEQVRTADGDCAVHEIEVLSVFKGPLKPGQAFRVTGLDVYRRAPGIAGAPDSRDLIGKGDVVYLFLVPKGKMGYAMYRLTDADWTVIESGCRLVADGRVYVFAQPHRARDMAALGGTRQSADTGGFMAMTHATFPGAPVPEAAAFDERLRGSIEHVASLAPLLDEHAPPEPGRSDEYVKLLLERSDVLRRERAITDKVGELIAVKVARSAQPERIARLRGETSRDPRAVLDHALQRAAGRAYLLERVADPGEPLTRRTDYAKILSDAGWEYNRECRDRQQQADAPAATFATDLARLAASNLDTDLAEPLLRGVARCAPGDPSKFETPPALAADLTAAAAVLAGAYQDAAPADRVRIGRALEAVAPERHHPSGASPPGS